MKKSDFISAVAKKSGESQRVCDAIVSAVAEVIVEECVNNGEDITIPNLGKFRQKYSPAREAFNPLTKQKIMAKASRTLKFTPTSSIKQIEE